MVTAKCSHFDEKVHQREDVRFTEASNRTTFFLLLKNMTFSHYQSDPIGCEVHCRQNVSHRVGLILCCLGRIRVLSPRINMLFH